jgi:hypothetical protein
MENNQSPIQLDEKSLQEINFSSLWMKNLNESFLRLQNFERNCRDGCVDILDYLEQNPQRLAELQFQYLRMSVTELGIILGNTKPKLSRAKFLHARVHLRQMKTAIDLHPEKIFIPTYNQLSNTTTYILSDTYWDFLDEISKIREWIIQELSDMIYGKGEAKSAVMDKSKSLQQAELVR